MKKVIIYIILLAFTTQLYPQKANYYKRLYIDAEYFLLYEEYIEALPLYIEIFGIQQNNMNIAYRIGECYLNLPNEKKKAIFYLEKAVQAISDEYQVGVYQEKNAPKDAIYLLGIGYRMNGELDKAMDTFMDYKSRLSEGEKEKVNEANHQIQICKNAKELMANPIDIKITNLGNGINSSFANIKPAVSSNDSILVFTSKLRFYDAVFFTQWTKNRWAPASNITPYLGTDGDINTCSLSPDGKQIYFTRYDWDNYNIYMSNYRNRVWSDIEKLDKKINSSKSNETHACITSDGKVIFFVSDREGGFGGKDIYKIELKDDGKWGEPENLGKTINTNKDEETPFITEDGTLFFSSEGHFSIGGFDIFVAKKNGNSWETPKNIGYPINSTEDDLNYLPLKNGKIAYYSLFRKEGFGDFDIYRIEF